MIPPVLLLLLPLLCLWSVAQAQPSPPVAAVVPHIVHSPHGDRVDEYHWLRDDDPVAKRPEVMRHLQAENDYSAAMLAPLQPLRDELLAEMRARIQAEDSSPPVYDHGWWTWRAYRAGAEHPVLMRRRGTPEAPDAQAEAEVLLDLNALAEGQAYFELGRVAVSPDGRWLAWTEDTSGRLVYTLRLKDLRTGQVLPDTRAGVVEDLAWANDGRTLFYLRQDPVTLQARAVMRLAPGRGVQADVQVYEEADKTLFVSLGRSASRRWVLIHIGDYDTSETRAIDADAPTRPPRRVLARRKGVRHEADHLNGRWVIRTNERAPNYRLVSAPEAAPDNRRSWRTLVASRREATIEGMVLLRRAIALQERVEADSRVVLLVGGRVQPVAAAPAATVMLGEHRDPDAAHLRYTVTSMVQPQATWDLHLASGRRVLRQQRTVPGYEGARYATERLWLPSRDGQRIPATLAWRPDRARRDATAPLLMLGYGAYGLSYDPEFSASTASLLDRGFVVALAHVRGGAELGQDWYEAGRLLHKRNTFNDFVDAADALVRQGWADPRRLFASGGSAGGLLMGVVANEAPQRWRGIALQVPFVDVVTTMLDGSIPLTANEWSQWGDPRHKAVYDYLLSYSPYDNLRAQDYPAMLVSTGLWDGQVQYFEPAKYVARLRARKTDRHPLLLHVNMAAGHGGPSGRYAALEDVAREFAFFIDLAGLRTPPAPRP